MDMKTVAVHLDDEAATALANLVRAARSDQSKVLRALIVDAERARILAQAHAEAKTLRDDPEYQAEIRALDGLLEPDPGDSRAPEGAADRGAPPL